MLERTLEMHVPTEGEDDRFSAGCRDLCAGRRTGGRCEGERENEQRDEPIHRAKIATCGSLPRTPALGVGSALVRKGIVQLVAIGVVIGIAVTLVAVLFQWLPTSNSEEFDRIQEGIDRSEIPTILAAKGVTDEEDLAREQVNSNDPVVKIGIEWAGLRRAATVLSIRANSAWPDVRWRGRHVAFG